MRDLVGGALGFVVVAVVLIIGGAIVAETVTTSVDISGNSTLVQDLSTNTGTALTTFSSMLTIVALALIGGLALFYVLGFVGGRR